MWVILGTSCVMSALPRYWLLAHPIILTRWLAIRSEGLGNAMRTRPTHAEGGPELAPNANITVNVGQHLDITYFRLFLFAAWSTKIALFRISLRLKWMPLRWPHFKRNHPLVYQTQPLEKDKTHFFPILERAIFAWNNYFLVLISSLASW